MMKNISRRFNHSMVTLFLHFAALCYWQSLQSEKTIISTSELRVEVRKNEQNVHKCFISLEIVALFSIV